MNKYEHKADLDNILVIGKLLHFLRTIQTQVRHGYEYYVTGSTSPQKLVRLINKLDKVYDIGESSKDRYRRFKLNLPTVQMIVFFPEGANEVYFVLLARCGCNGSKNHFFFSAEKYKSLINKNESLTINHYVLKRVNKERYLFDEGEDSTKVIAGKNEVWTYDLTNKYIAEVLDNVRISLMRRDNNLVNQLLRSFERVIPFHGVRKTYQKMAVKINSMVEKSSNADGKWINVKPLPTSLKILRASSIKKYNLNELLKLTTIKSQE